VEAEQTIEYLYRNPQSMVHIYTPAFTTTSKAQFGKKRFKNENENEQNEKKNR
jgi:hypothetical protein